MEVSYESRSTTARCIREGEQAYAEGKPVDACPYGAAVTSLHERCAWLAGWHDARTWGVTAKVYCAGR